MNWGFILPITGCVLLWLALGYAVWHRDEFPAIFSSAKAPFEEGELWQLNFR